ncbi:uncharacterized protein J3R85_001030 [Psidium guajava]|nr:uncharacterized protein J3R85_001030 [Psidium guajava]
MSTIDLLEGRMSEIRGWIVELDDEMRRIGYYRVWFCLCQCSMDFKLLVC